MDREGTENAPADVPPAPTPPVDEASLLNAIEEFVDQVRAHTIVQGEGRLVATIGGARALSHAFNVLSSRVSPDLRRMVEHGDVPVEAHPDAVGVRVGRAHFDRHDEVAVVRAALCDALHEIVKTPTERLNEQSALPVEDRQQFYVGDVLGPDLLGHLESVRYLLRLRLAKGDPGPLPRSSSKASKNQKSRSRPPLSDNAKRIAKVLVDLREGNGLDRKEIPLKTAVPQGSVNRALRELRTWGVGSGKKGTGVYVDGDENRAALRRAIGRSQL